jgi:hypothetical protein
MASFHKYSNSLFIIIPISEVIYIELFTAAIYNCGMEIRVGKEWV